MANYGGFARVYDLFMDNRGLYDWPTYIRQLLQEELGVPSRGRILDAGCGTGHLTVALAQAGYRMYGVDLSDAMLDRAARAAREAGVHIRFAQMDVRELCLDVQVDAVTCACDPVNYLHDAGEVRAFFAGAYGALRHGGWLLFDVCTPHYYAHVLGTQTFAHVEEDAAYILQTEADGAQCRMQLTGFAQHRSGYYARFDETHLLTGHTEADLRLWLHEQGFDDVRAYAFGTHRAAQAQDERWQFVVFKA